jgi:hypothetical protein
MGGYLTTGRSGYVVATAPPEKEARRGHANNPDKANTLTNAHLGQSELMPEKTVKRWLQEAGDDALASDDGPIFSTVAELVEALKRSIPEGTQSAELKKEALRLGRELLRRTEYEEE